MNPHVVAKSAKNLLAALEIKFDRSIGRECAPARMDILCIETTSACNLKCRLCGYVKKHSPRISMKDAMFESCIAQAVGLGFRHFDLTPCTGDLFMDRRIFNKFRILEDNSDVEGFHFFTNLSIPKPEQIERMVGLNKVEKITVSIYGHDLESFVAITQSTAKVYARLLANLETLYGLLDRKKFHLEFGFRTTRDAPRSPTSDLMRLLERFKQRGVKVRGSHVYNNWGGYITQDDVQGLAIDIAGTEDTYKNGACVYLFTSVQVMASGIVNGCACRDVDATLRIGDIRETPLREILSTSNPAYMQLIDEQQRGAFRPVCQSCDFYKSIYHHRSRDRNEGRGLQSIQQFKDRMDAPGKTKARQLQPASVSK
jgi:MoaA/NifB/PqqE/SkfB family radical SAM enzyme